MGSEGEDDTIFITATEESRKHVEPKVIDLPENKESMNGNIKQDCEVIKMQQLVLNCNEDLQFPIHFLWCCTTVDQLPAKDIDDRKLFKINCLTTER